MREDNLKEGIIMGKLQFCPTHDKFSSFSMINCIAIMRIE